MPGVSYPFGQPSPVARRALAKPFQATSVGPVPCLNSWQVEPLTEVGWEGSGRSALSEPKNKGAKTGGKGQP